MYLSQHDCLDIEKTFSGALPESFTVVDHLFGFDQDLRNSVLDSFSRLAEKYQTTLAVKLSYFVDESLKQTYPKLNLQFALDSCPRIHHLKDYKIHPAIDFKNFVCSFNGSAHVSRQLLTAALHKFQMVNTDYFTKHFSFSLSDLDGNLLTLAKDRFAYYRKFFIGDDSEIFFGKIIAIETPSYNHMKNIYLLENMVTQSFVHLVSETMATSYYPLISEKCFYSIATRGLFLSYAQPNWHAHLENYYGFRLYKNLFDYRFDTIKNPVERLVELLSMISKFQKLSATDWQDLYELEKENIEYNYDHYFSGQYMKDLYD
jgi:hypothetical protein